MNGITILIWITIAIIGIIAIVVVKMHYADKELETSEKSMIPNTNGLSGILSSRKDKVDKAISSSSHHEPNKSLYGNKKSVSHDSDAYIVPEVNDSKLKDFEYESENQILINYGNEVKKFQEPIKQNQMDIMTQNNKEEKTELKDLFTIDELIKESKRKDSEREKESQSIKKDDDLTEIKESIKQRQESKVQEPLIEEIVNESESIDEPHIEEIINESESVDEPHIEEIINESDTIEELLNETTGESAEDIFEDSESETPFASQKEIEEAITSASLESEEEIESISEETNITDVLLDSNEEEAEIPEEEIKEPALKSPSKIGESKEDDFGAPIENTNLFESDEYKMDLDYRKDLDKITNKIRSSKIFQEVKGKLTQESEEIPQSEEVYGEVEETYIRNVNEYDDFEPIINETHIDYEEPQDDFIEITDDQRLRQENTRKVFNIAKNSSPDIEISEPKISPIKEKPSRDNIKLTLNNNEVVLKKGDEIIFNHDGETYSSQVYAINGDDISVRYRRKNITIKPKDVKKIY